MGDQNLAELHFMLMLEAGFILFLLQELEFIN